MPRISSQNPWKTAKSLIISRLDDSLEWTSLMGSLAQSQPWLAERISRATWFRRQKEKGSPDGRRKPKRLAAPNSAEPVIDAAIPRNALSRASEAELATVRAKVAAIGPGAVITKTDGRFDVVTSETFEARGQSLPPARSRVTPPLHSRQLTVTQPPLQGEIIPPPQSMIADGGTPARRYPANASVAEATALIRAHAAEQARANAEMARRMDALERARAEDARRIAALEDRRSTVVAVIRAFAGMFSLV
jgi:hypothetical protein